MEWTTKKILPFLVTQTTIKYDIYSLDSYDGFKIGPTRLEDDVFMITCVEVDYSVIKEGDVFVVSEDGDISCDEPSSFMIKGEFGNFYLTMNKDMPLGVDHGQYDKVMLIIND